MNGFVYIPGSQINTQNNGLFSILNRQGRQSSFNLTNGDTFSATLTHREGDKAFLRIKGNTDENLTFSVPGNSIKGDVGDTLNFKVVKQDKSGLALKQVFSKSVEVAVERGNAGIDDVKQVAKSLEQKSEDAEYRDTAQKEQQVKAARAMSQIRRSQRLMSDNSGRAAISAIVTSGLDLHKISFFTLSNIVKEIESLPKIPEYTTSQDPQQTASLNKVDSLLAGEISDDAIVQILRSDKDITPAQVYAGRHSTGYDNIGKAISTDLDLDEQIIKIFDREGIESTPRNMEAARFLVAHDLPVTKYNVEAYVLLKNLDSIPKEMLSAQIAEALSQGNDPAQMKLLPLLSSIDMGVALDTVKALPSITPQDVQKVMEANQPLDLQHLAKAYTLEEKPYIKISVPEQEIITAQRQLAEIQWKMTFQAAIRLTNSGISINTEPIRELVQQLRALEKDSFARHLRGIGAEDTIQNVAKMENVFRAIQDIRPTFSAISSNIQAKILTQQVDFTLTGVHQATLASLAYESSATTPNARYGDSFSKITGQFEGLLKQLGIEATAENIRAATILSRNTVDVDMSNIEAIKAIDAKISAVLDRLNPMMAAQMLKEGLQPLDMHVDEMLSYVRKYEKINGYDSNDKIAQYILEMDKNKSLTSQERSGMIAVYRMFNLIQKNGAAALGLALKQDTPLTLGGLMEAAKFYDRGKHIHGALDASVDDNFGLLESANRSGESIRAAISQAAIPLSYTDVLTDALVESATPNNLQEWMKNSDKALEDQLHRIEYSDSFQPDVQQATKAMQQFMEAPPSLISMLQNSGVIPTPNNLKAARKMSENNFTESLSKLLDEIEEVKVSDFAESSSIQEMYENKESRGQMLNKIWHALEDALPTEAVREAKGLIEAEYALRDANEDSVDIPLVLNGRLASLKMYTLNEEAVLDGSARTFLSITTGALGNVQSYFSIEDGKVNLQFAAPSPASRDKLEAGLDMLASLLHEAGYEIGDISFTYGAIKKETTHFIPQGKEAAIDVDQKDRENLQLDLSDYEFRV
ncbi:MAG: flagellar hook-length control protein FliK [Defluviitaleaceae bacterium]|nr:flagellar hook-length control protein FliK [Defluviitaleaceae bacterium]